MYLFDDLYCFCFFVLCFGILSDVVLKLFGTCSELICSTVWICWTLFWNFFGICFPDVFLNLFGFVFRLFSSILELDVGVFCLTGQCRSGSFLGLVVVNYCRSSAV